MLRGLRRAWPFAILIAAPFILFWPANTGEVVLTPGDALVMFTPLRLIAMRQLAAGELPLWNPWLFSGFPLLGCMISGVLYPLTWLYLLLPAPLAANLGVQLTVAAAGLTTYAYTRAIGATRPAALLGGLTFATCGFAMSQIGAVPLHQGVPWLPLLLLALERLRHTAGAGWVGVGAVAVALPIFAGHPQMPVYSLMVAVLYVAFFTLAERPSVGRWRYAARAGATLGVGLALAAAQLLPTAELGAESVRADLPYASFVEMAVAPLQLQGLVFPRLFSDLVATRSGTGAHSVGKQAIYIGVVPLMLAAAAAFGAWRSAMVRFWTLLAAFALLLCLGDALPPLAQLMYTVPIYNLIRIPQRNLFEFQLAIAVLAALGLSAGHTAAGRRALWRAARGVGLSMVLVAALWVGAGEAIWGGLIAARVADGLTVARTTGAFSLTAPSVALPLLSAALAAALVRWLSRGARAWPIAGLIALLCVDVLGQGPLSQLAVPVAGHLRRSPLTTALQRTVPGEQRVLFASAGGMTAVDERPTLAGLRLVQGYDSLLLARYSAFARMDYAGRVDPSILLGTPVLDLLHTGTLALAFPHRPDAGVRIGRLAFAFGELSDALRPGEAVEFPLPAPRRVGALGAVTMMGDSVGVPDDAPVARITLTGAQGEHRQLWLRAGAHTAEWAWDLAHVAPQVRHRRAPIAESFTLNGAVAHRYAAELHLAQPFDAVRVRIESVAPAGVLQLARLTLYDPVAHRSAVLTDAHRVLDDPARWERRFALRTGGGARAPAGLALPWSTWSAHAARPWREPSGAGAVWVEGLENRRVLPRAWLVSRTLPLSADAVLASVHSGRLPDGSPFDPRATALVEAAPARDFGPPDPGAFVEVVAERAGAIELRTQAQTATFLVASEIFYPGWRATIDGAPAAIVRTNYVLRGLELPAGEHRVRFVYRPTSAYAGLALSGVTALLLAAAALRPYVRLASRLST